MNEGIHRLSRQKSIQNYVQQQNLTDSIDALVAGLIVLKPTSPIDWCIGALTVLADMPPYSISWDCLIPIEQRPKCKNFGKALGYLDEIFRLGNMTEIPDPEMFEKAYNHYYRQLKLKAWLALYRYKTDKIKKRTILNNRLRSARRYYRSRICKLAIEKWLEWTKSQLATAKKAEDKLRSVWEGYFQHTVITTWKKTAEEIKATRLYFEQLDKGESSSLNAEELENLGIDICRDPISLLPRKVAIQIFGYLNLVDMTTCSFVCRAWKVLSASPCLWAKLDFYRVRHLFNRNDDSVITILNKCRAYLIHLNLRCQYNLAPSTLKVIGNCHNLQDLNLSECNGITDFVLLAIVEGCPGLLYLNLSSTTTSDVGLKDIGRFCENLVYLNISNCHKFTDRGIHSIAMGKSSKKITYLDISRCPQITIQGYYSIAKGFTNIQHLILNYNYTITDQAVIVVVQKLIKLRIIELKKCPDISDQSIKYLAECRTLTKICFEESPKVSDIAIKVLAKYCPLWANAILVDCVRVTDISIKALSQLKGLLELNVADCSRITDMGIKYLTDGPACKHVNILDLTNVVRLSDMSLWKISKNMVNLKRLSIAYCENVTESGLEQLCQLYNVYYLDLTGTQLTDEVFAKLGKMHSLSRIVISECKYISDHGLGKFCNRIKDKLESLDISHCKDITDKPMKTIAYYCRNLKSLNFAGCYKLTDITPSYICSVCKKIETFDISGCYYMTDGCLQHFKKARELKLLVLKFCRNITNEGYLKIQQFIPEIYYDHDDAPKWFGYGNVPDLVNMPVGSKVYHEKKKKKKKISTKIEQNEPLVVSVDSNLTPKQRHRATVQGRWQTLEKNVLKEIKRKTIIESSTETSTQSSSRISSAMTNFSSDKSRPPSSKLKTIKDERLSRAPSTVSEISIPNTKSKNSSRSNSSLSNREDFVTKTFSLTDGSLTRFTPLAVRMSCSDCILPRDERRNSVRSTASALPKLVGNSSITKFDNFVDLNKRRNSTSMANREYRKASGSSSKSFGKSILKNSENDKYFKPMSAEQIHNSSRRSSFARSRTESASTIQSSKSFRSITSSQ